MLPSCLALSALLMLQACTNAPSKEQQAKDSLAAAQKTVEEKKMQAFKQMLAKFKTLALPINMQPFKMQDDLGTQYILASDTLFINTEYKDTSVGKVYAYGMLPDTAETYKLIYFLPAEIYVPMIATFDKAANKIDDKPLYMGYCGSDCCFTCTESITIDAAMNIRSEDDISSCECDGGGPKPSTMKHYKLYKTGSIDKNGKVTLSEMKREDFKQ
jgi:hypothetical protein